MSGALPDDGVASPNRERDPDPDAVPVNPPDPALDPSAVFSLPRTVEGRIGADMAKLAWRARMRWLDDGGR